MELHNGTLFWPTTYSKPTHENPPLAPHYDVLIIGGGMSGLLTAKALLDEGLTVALLERDEIGAGSTAANTGLLQYSNDIPLHELIDLIGERDAVRFYQLCYEALDALEVIASTLPDTTDFIRRPSICYASKKRDVKKLIKEYEALTKHGFPCEFWDSDTVKARLPFEAPAALYTAGDAEINPYKFVVALSEQLKARGLVIFEKMMANIIEPHDTHIELHTIAGIFNTTRLIYTTGYDRLPYGNIKGANINRSYVIVTQQLVDFKGWHEHALIWETARPYLYMRMTRDYRIIIGGLDEKKAKPAKYETKLEAMTNKLLAQLSELIPGEKFSAPFHYSASFGESKDHLPFIGQHPSEPNHYYLLGYGGNGTVYSMLGAKILVDLIEDRPNDDARIVTLKRKYGLKD